MAAVGSALAPYSDFDVLSLPARTVGPDGHVSTAQARFLRVVLPVRHEELHGHGIVARTLGNPLVQFMRLFYLGHVDVDAQTTLIRNRYLTADNLQRLDGRRS